MTGVPKFNIPRFDEVASEMRAMDYEVINPAELDSPELRALALASKTGDLEDIESSGETWGDIMARDVKVVADQVTDLVLLPGWNGSRGACLESFVGLLCNHQFHIWAEEFGLVTVDRSYIRSEVL